MVEGFDVDVGQASRSPRILDHCVFLSTSRVVSNLSDAIVQVCFTNVCVREVLLTFLEAEAGIVRVIATVLCRVGPRPVLIRVS